MAGTSKAGIWYSQLCFLNEKNNENNLHQYIQMIKIPIRNTFIIKAVWDIRHIFKNVH